MTAVSVLKQATGKTLRRRVLSNKLFALPRISPLMSIDEERLEVLEGIRSAMRSKTVSPACGAACSFLLRHLARG